MCESSSFPALGPIPRQGTEEIHSGEYNDHFEKGTYHCSGCGQALYRSEHKFRSGHGWPAFSDSLPEALDRHGTGKVEVTCRGCGGHLGHVFRSSRYPKPRNERHCVNSVSLHFRPDAAGPGAAAPGAAGRAPPASEAAPPGRAAR
ncbi:unnamed protein product, partial [Prorocentrum cordatum]